MEHNPFVAPDVDPRAKEIEEARKNMATGVGATTSLPPAYEDLKQLTRWMAEHNRFDQEAIADAVESPATYWEYMQAAKAQEAMNDGE